MAKQLVFSEDARRGLKRGIDVLATAVVTTLGGAAADILGATPPVRGVRFGSDMRLLANVGGIPTVLFGPGDVREAHRPNESVAAEDLLRATQILVLATMRFCGTAER